MKKRKRKQLKDRKRAWFRVDVSHFFVALSHRLEKAIKLLKLEPFMKFFWNCKQNSEEYIKKTARARCVVKISYMKLVFTNII